MCARILDTADLIDGNQIVLFRLRDSKKKAVLRVRQVLEVIKKYTEAVFPELECFI